MAISTTAIRQVGILLIGVSYLLGVVDKLVVRRHKEEISPRKPSPRKAPSQAGLGAELRDQGFFAVRG